MSEFDKEAERERLREKFEAEREEREATQRMSELLLKGATMTNRHCEECGDPIFRYEGEEFCPTCRTSGAELTATDGEQAAQAEAEPSAEAETDAEAAAELEPDDEQIPDQAEEPSAATESGGRAGAESEPEPTTAEPEAERAAGPPSTPTPQSPREPDRTAAVGEGGDLAASRAAVSRTLADLARRVEETEDLGRKRTLLAAVREAAEAITAIDEASR